MQRLNQTPARWIAPKTNSSGSRTEAAMFVRRSFLLAMMVCTGPALAVAQTTSTDNAPRTPKGDDPSYGTSTSPATMSSTPVPMKPEASQQDGQKAAGSAPAGSR
jgi:hypothetical protein